MLSSTDLDATGTKRLEEGSEEEFVVVGLTALAPGQWLDFLVLGEEVG